MYPDKMYRRVEQKCCSTSSNSASGRSFVWESNLPSIIPLEKNLPPKNPPRQNARFHLRVEFSLRSV